MRASPSRSEMTNGRATIELTTRRPPIRQSTLSLAGRHQIGNAVVAARVLETWAARRTPVDRLASRLDWSDCEWPGRLEWLRLASGRRGAPRCRSQSIGSRRSCRLPRRRARLRRFRSCSRRCATRTSKACWRRSCHLPASSSPRPCPPPAPSMPSRWPATWYGSRPM